MMLARLRRCDPSLTVRGLFFACGALALYGLLVGCAAQAPPPGGPADTTRPRIDTTIPTSGSLNVAPGASFYFRFRQDVDRASFQQAFSITPYMDGAPKFSWSGHDEVRVTLPHKLQDSTTYTISLSRDLKSARGNTLATPLRLTFSTGSYIDSGTVAGQVLPPLMGSPTKAGDLYVFAYDVTGPRGDTINPTVTPADLMTQPDDKGAWQFFAMKSGHTYRIFAVGDVYRNHVYDPGIDAFGVPTSTVRPSGSLAQSIHIRMSPALDTIRPELQDVEVVDSFHVRAHFSEAIDSNDVRASNFLIQGNPALAAFRENAATKPGQVTLLTPVSLTPNGGCHLEIVKGSIHDLAGNPLSDSGRAVSTQAPAILRTPAESRFALVSIRDSSVDATTKPSISITFRDAVVRDSVEHIFTLTDSVGHAVQLVFSWSDDAHLTVTPRDTLLATAWYALRGRTSAWKSPSGAIPLAVKDSALRWRFRTTNMRDYGRMTGEVTFGDSSFTGSPLGVIVVQVYQAPATVIRQSVLPHGTGSFVFDQLPSGTYRVRAYYSPDGSGSYLSGSVRPWRPGVPTGEYAKDVIIRPRWEMSKIDLEVK